MRMRTTWLAILLAAFITVPVSAQFRAVSVRAGASDPATCTPDSTNIFLNTTSDTLKVCSATNTWTAAGSPFTGGTVTTAITSPGYVAAQTLGAEIATQTCAGWGLAAPVGAWSCSGSTITRTASGANLTITNSAAVVGTTYKVVTVTATVSAGSVVASMGASSGATISTATTTTDYLTATTTGALTLTASATFAGTITITTTSAKAITSTISSDVGPLVVTSPGSLRFFPASGFTSQFYNGISVVSGQSLVGDGTVSAPGLSTVSQPNSGIFFNRSANYVEVSTDGAKSVSFAPSANIYFWDSGGTNISMHRAGSMLRMVSGATLAFTSSATDATSVADTAIARSAAGVVKGTDGSTGIRFLQGGGTAVASATALPLPTGRVFHVTGTTNITSITATNFQAGVIVTLIFDGVLTFTDGSNLKLAGDFVTTADDTISLAFDGTNFYEQSRSVN